MRRSTSVEVSSAIRSQMGTDVSPGRAAVLVWAAVAAIIASPRLLMAQTAPTGRLHGQVLDTSGQPLPTVLVEVETSGGRAECQDGNRWSLRNRGCARRRVLRQVLAYQLRDPASPQRGRRRRRHGHRECHPLRRRHLVGRCHGSTHVPQPVDSVGAGRAHRGRGRGQHRCHYPARDRGTRAGAVRRKRWRACPEWS